MLQSEMYAKVSHSLNIPLDRVIEYDKQMWNFIRLSLNNPTFDVLEIPFLGSFSITKVKMGRTLRSSLIVIRKTRDKLARYPNNAQLKIRLENEKILFRNLWKLKQQCKL